MTRALQKLSRDDDDELGVGSDDETMGEHPLHIYLICELPMDVVTLPVLVPLISVSSSDVATKSYKKLLSPQQRN